MCTLGGGDGGGGDGGGDGGGGDGAPLMPATNEDDTSVTHNAPEKLSGKLGAVSTLSA